MVRAAERAVAATMRREVILMLVMKRVEPSKRVA
jgi:hypothetical protein